MHRNYSLESCITTVEEGIYAQQQGADRVEICSRLETEGMTPEIEVIETLCHQLTIPIRVMVRVTERGFEATQKELEEMIQSIHAIKKLPVDGFVIGVLKNNQLDREAMLQLLEAAYPLHVTVHKALDASATMMEDLNWINSQKQIDTVLTSGNAATAQEGAPVILEMKKLFDRHIMAGGKVRTGSFPLLHEQLELKWYHGRGIV